MPSPNGISDCSIEVGITTSKPATLAPPSSTARGRGRSRRSRSASASPSNGAVCRLSSSIATTTRRRGDGSCRRPNISQRSAVRRSSERPRIGRTTGETEAAAQTSAMAAITILVARAAPDPQRPEGPTRLLHPQQPADDRRRAGFGLRVDPEHDFRRFERRERRGRRGPARRSRWRNRRTLPLSWVPPSSIC